ncbi:MAG: response regulator [Verrucomicrobiota bacterium]
MANSKQSSTSRQVLFVDDEPDFLQVVRDTMAMLSGPRWKIYCAASADAALDLIKQHKLDLVVVDTSMPVLDGIQFLSLLGKRFPELKKVSLTAFATEEKRTACLAAGAELFIEKPHSAEGFKSVFAMLDDLMGWAPQQGFQGMLRRVGLQDVIQMECLGRNSSVLEVYNEHVLGRIYIEEGCIIHAAGGDLTGERALQRLLALPGGSFELVPFEPPPQKSIAGPWEFLLMEAARVRDEMASQSSPGEPEVDPRTLAAPTATTVRVVETLVCSGMGKVLYEADCADVPGRVLLLKNIGRQAAHLAQIIALGHFDRLELQLPNGRVVAQARPDRLVFVAVANTSPVS